MYGASIADGDEEASDPNTSIADRDRRANNPGIGKKVKNGWADDPGTEIADGNEKADDPGTDTENRDGGTDNPVVGTANGNKREDCLGTGTGTIHRGADNSVTVTSEIDVDRRAENPGTGIADINKANKLGTNVDKRADRQLTISNKACMFLFSLWKAHFILTSSSKLETVFTYSFIFLSSSVTLVKQGAPFSKYPVTEMWMLGFN